MSEDQSDWIGAAIITAGFAAFHPVAGVLAFLVTSWMCYEEKQARKKRDEAPNTDEIRQTEGQ